jgi:hypothetical protein
MSLLQDTNRAAQGPPRVDPHSGNELVVSLRAFCLFLRIRNPRVCSLVVMSGAPELICSERT